MTNISLQDLRGLAKRVLLASKTSEENATSVASALVKADADDIPSHGISRLPMYADQSKCGKVDGFAEPIATKRNGAVVHIDGRCGFSYPAIDLGLYKAFQIVKETGVVALAIGNSSHAGVIGHHVERIANRGLAAIAFVNTPAAISPWGGSKPLYGTNPIAFACPRPETFPLVIDLSISKVARGKIKLAKDKGDKIPDNWARDANGQPTNDAKAVIQGGSILPIGNAKGAALALMVELMGAAMTGSQFGFEASSFLDTKDGPSKTGQFFFIFKPENFGGDGVFSRIETLIKEINNQPGARIPGQRRFETRAIAETRGVNIPDILLRSLSLRVE